MANAKRDGNRVPTLIAVSNADGETPVVLWADPITHRLLVDLSGSGSGDVSGPASSTDNAIARFNGATGKIIQNSGITIDDSDGISGATINAASNTFVDIPTSAAASVTGSDTNFVTGTAGTSGNIVQWDANGDAIDGGIAVGDIYSAGGTDVAVADGGTGRSSHTAYAVICGGTTATGAQQSIAGVGTSGQVLTSNGAGALPTFQDSASGIGGSTGATDNAILRADGTGGSTVQSSGITIDDSDNIDGVASVTLDTGGSIDINGDAIISDSAGTATLSNIDALDATTEATIEAAIDTLANLTSIQSFTVTLADAGADAFFGWDDSASAYENLSKAEAQAVLGLETSSTDNAIVRFDSTGGNTQNSGVTIDDSNNLDTPGVISGATLEADGDTSAGDNAAIGYTAAEGIIITGQGSTADVTIKNDADGTVAQVPTGTTDFEFQAAAIFDAEVDNGNSGTSDTIDWTAGNKQRSTLTGNVTFTFTEPNGPCNLIFKLIQDGTGSRTVTWPGDVLWPGGTAPTLTTDASAVDIVSFYYDGTDFYGQAGLDFS